jgi:hypothetical protein
MSNDVLIGYEMLIDMEGSPFSLPKVNDAKYLIKWVKQLVKDIDMNPFGEPVVTYFDGSDFPDGEDNKAGGVPLIPYRF